MKNKGFTLAEVLITLGIIGVVAALAAPALNSAVQKSKVAPSLKKFVSTMENANELIIQDNDADRLSRVGLGHEIYLSELKKHVTGSIDKDTSGNLKNLVSYGSPLKTYTGVAKTQQANYYVYKLPKGDSLAVWGMDRVYGVEGDQSFKGQYANVIYDINGFENKPNVMGKDAFVFIIDDGGSVLPLGSDISRVALNDTEGRYDWRKASACPNDKKPGVDSQFCTGAIADNGWKVMYKY